MTTFRNKTLQILWETFIASLPLAVVIAVVTVFIAPFDNKFYYIRLLIGYIGVVVGQAFFLVGLEYSIFPMGERMGASLVKIKHLSVILLFGLLFGVLAEVAEPGLAVFARQTHLLIPVIDETLFRWVLAFGIGIFVAIALLRIVKEISIKWVLGVLYALLLMLAFIVPPEFIALAFDGSGSTTGDVSVPVILALGMGVSLSLSKRKTNDNVFGIVGIASVGPILAVFVYGLILQGVHGDISHYVTDYNPMSESASVLTVLRDNIWYVFMAILPIFAFFILFQYWKIRMPGRDLRRVLLGIIPVFIGLLIFLAGIDFGFAFAGKYIGDIFVDPSRAGWFQWVLLPVAFILGAAITLSEPAVKVLSAKLEEVTERKFRSRSIRWTLALSIGVATLLSVVKILTEIHILWFLMPMYACALVLMMFSTRFFVGLAFDSGGATSGALTSALLTPMALGIAQAVARGAGAHAQSVLINGFGIIAFMSVTPLIAVQILGLMAKRKKI